MPPLEQAGLQLHHLEDIFIEWDKLLYLVNLSLDSKQPALRGTNPTWDEESQTKDGVFVQPGLKKEVRVEHMKLPSCADSRVRLCLAMLA